jgi:TetR/AcrR family transcriptional repressor of bet genes
MTVQPKKQKKRIEEIRRIELIEAAYRIFIKDGLKGLTTTRICQEAGMSQGILTYYFKDKDEVLFEMVRHANRILMDDVVVGGGGGGRGGGGRRGVGVGD